MNLNHHLLFLFTVCLVVGCSHGPVYVPLPPSHPASVCAPESPIEPRSSTLRLTPGSPLSPNPDWQKPGLRANERHGHAAGPVDHSMPGMSMHMSHDQEMKSPPQSMPGMIKFEAPADVVDYAPTGTPSTPKKNQPIAVEDLPEVHLDHTDPARREAPTSQAPIAPPPANMKHDMSTTPTGSSPMHHH